MQGQAAGFLADIRDLQRINGILGAAKRGAEDQLRRALVRLRRIKSIQAVVRASAPQPAEGSDNAANLELLRQLEAKARLRVEAARLQYRALNASGRPMSRILAHLTPLLLDPGTSAGAAAQASGIAPAVELPQSQEAAPPEERS